MDAESAATAQRAIIAAFRGKSWVDETYALGTEEFRFYTLSAVLFAEDRSTWLSFLTAIRADGPQTLESRQRRGLRQKGRKILDDIDPGVAWS